MTTLIQDVDGYADAVEILTYLSKALNNKLARTTPSNEPTSDFRKLDKALRDTLDARLALAARALEQSNAAIAASGAVAQVKAAAADAKAEAEKIKKAVKVVDDLVGFVDKIVSNVGLVGKILAL